MSAVHEVISAFLDDEPFDPRDLARALDDPAGRTLLIDSITLRRIVQPTDSIPPMKAPASVRRFGWRAAAAAALFVVALTGGYMVGERRSVAPAPEAEAPPPTRVVQAVPFIPSGGGR
jgi:hypothetical protein